MEAEYFVRYINYGKLNKESKDVEDFVDRINYRYTSVVLAIMTGIVGMRQYVGKQIECWIPQEFTKGWEDYAESYCFVSSTYFHKIQQRLSSRRSSLSAGVHEQLPASRDSNSRGPLSISYYQWAPLFLLAQMLLCVLPHALWRVALAARSRTWGCCSRGAATGGRSVALPCRQLAAVAARCNVLLPHDLARHATLVADHLAHCLDKQQIPHQNVTGTSSHPSVSCAVVSPTSTTRNRRYPMLCSQPGHRLFLMYLSIKLVSLITQLGQLLAMEYFIGAKFHFYGVRILYDFFLGRYWDYSGHFPRVTFCDFEAKKIGKNDPYTLQCVLPLNMFLEKIFIFMWLWFAVMAVLTLASLCYWLALMGSEAARTDFVRGSLGAQSMLHQWQPLPRAPHAAAPPLRSEDKPPCFQPHEVVPPPLCEAQLMQFTRHYLGPDSVFLLQQLAGQQTGGGEALVTEVVARLWQHHSRRYPHPPQIGAHTLANLVALLPPPLSARSSQLDDLKEEHLDDDNEEGHTSKSIADEFIV